MKEYLSTPKDHSEIEFTIANCVIKRLSPLFSEYPSTLDVIKFLKQIGVFTETEDVTLYQTSHKGKFDHLEFLSEKGDANVAEAKSLAASLVKKGAHRYIQENTVDPLSKLRVEMKDTVYAIDDPTAHEIDDGISLEETPEGTWIHIHIADPTAYIPPSSRLAMLAEQRGTSVYLAHRHFPLMPNFLSDELFNLGVSPCAMTFSARLSGGVIADYKIQPTLLPNVRQCTYDNVDTVLSWDKNIEKDPPAWATVQKQRSKLPPHGSFSKQDIDILQKLQRLVLEHRDNRLRNGALIPDQLSMSVKVVEAPLDITPRYLQTSFDHDCFSQSSTIKINPFNLSHRAPSHTLVSESMILAGRIAAKYCTDRKLPVAYRCQLSISENMALLNPDYLNAAEEALSNAREHTDKETGITAFTHFKNILRYMPAAYMSSKPKSHFSMGIQDSGSFPGYLKVTSPLRRYQDMMSHYQIQASLLDQKPVFSIEEVVAKTKRLEAINALEKSLSKRSNRFWTLEYLKRKCWEPNGSLVSPVLKTYKSGFEFADNLDQPVYYALAEYYPRVGRGKDCFVVLPELGGLRGRCITKTGATEEPEIMVAVEKVYPDVGLCIFRQV